MTKKGVTHFWKRGSLGKPACGQWSKSSTITMIREEVDCSLCRQTEEYKRIKEKTDDR